MAWVLVLYSIFHLTLYAQSSSGYWKGHSPSSAWRENQLAKQPSPNLHSQLERPIVDSEIVEQTVMFTGKFGIYTLCTLSPTKPDTASQVESCKKPLFLDSKKASPKQNSFLEVPTKTIPPSFIQKKIVKKSSIVGIVDDDSDEDLTFKGFHKNMRH